MRAPITIVHGQMDADSIIAAMEKENWRPATAYDPIAHKEYQPKSQKNSERFTISDRLNPHYKALWQKFDLAKTIIESHDDTAMIVGKELAVMRYGMHDHIKLHDDLGIQKNKPGFGGDVEVAYSCLLYLNAVDGGELVLPSIEKEVAPDAGTMVFFHASEKHAVNPVLSPARYAVLFRMYIRK